MTQGRPQQPQVLQYTMLQSNTRPVAKNQRVILICILLYFLCVMLQFLVTEEWKIALGIFALVVIITSAVYIFRLAVALYGAGMGILLGILTLIPCAGLIVLLIINSRATAYLKSQGVKVGFLGADVPSTM